MCKTPANAQTIEERQGIVNDKRAHLSKLRWGKLQVTDKNLCFSVGREGMSYRNVIFAVVMPIDTLFFVLLHDIKAPDWVLV